MSIFTYTKIWQYWYYKLYYVKTQKKFSNKILPQWALNLGPQPFESEALLSDAIEACVTWNILNCLVFLHHSILDLDHLVRTNRAWPYAALRSQVTHASIAQRAEHQIHVTEVLGSMFTGVTYYCVIISFHMVTSFMPILPLLKISANLWKPRIFLCILLLIASGTQFTCCLSVTICIYCKILHHMLLLQQSAIDNVIIRSLIQWY